MSFGFSLLFLFVPGRGVSGPRCKYLWSDLNQAPNAVKSIIQERPLARRIKAVGKKTGKKLAPYGLATVVDPIDQKLFFQQAQSKIARKLILAKIEFARKNSIYASGDLQVRIQQGLLAAKSGIERILNAIEREEKLSLEVIFQQAFYVAKAMDFLPSEALLNEYKKYLRFIMENGADGASKLLNEIEVSRTPLKVFREHISEQVFIRFSPYERFFLNQFVKNPEDKIEPLDWRLTFSQGYLYPLLSWEQPNQTLQLEARSQFIHVISFVEKVFNYDTFHFANPSFHPIHDLGHRVFFKEVQPSLIPMDFKAYVLIHKQFADFWIFSQNWLLESGLSYSDIYSVLHLVSLLLHEESKTFYANIYSSSQENSPRGYHEVNLADLVVATKYYGELRFIFDEGVFLRQGMMLRDQLLSDYTDLKFAHEGEDE